MSKIIKYRPLIENNSKVIEVRSFYEENSDDEQVQTPSFELERQKIIRDAQAQADILIENARLEANIIVREAEQNRTDWEVEKLALNKKAYEDGFQSGLLEGRKAGFSEYAGLVEVAKQTTEAAKADYIQYVDSAEETILTLAIAVAEKIITASLEEKRQLFVDLVRDALKVVREHKEVEIHVHPNNYKLLLAEKADLDAIFPSDINCFIYPNSDLAENACYIESDNGRVDASISSQLKELKQSLTALLHGESI